MLAPVETPAAPQRLAVRWFTPTAPEVSFERILRIQGYSDLGRVRPVIRAAAQSMATAAGTLSEPAIAWRRVDVRQVHGEVLELESGARLRCAAFERQLAGCDAIAVFVLSLGAALPARVVELAERGDLLEGLLLETAGWLAIEDATRQFKVRLREEIAAQGRRITSRLGPGYSYKVGGRMRDWPLEEQRALFALFEGVPIPVQLMSSCAMSPKMSRSGIYGIAPETNYPEESAT